MSDRKYLGLKTGLQPDHVRDRLQYHPDILELHLTEEDVLHPDTLAESVRSIKEHVPKIYLHHPAKYKGEYLDIISNSPDMGRFYDESTFTLIEICRREDVQTVIHPH